MNDENCQAPSLLILDVDETLLFASEKRLAHPAHFRAGEYYVYLRPGLHEFLQACARRYRLAVWSSAGADYLAIVRAHGFPAGIELEFIWSGQRCVRRYDPEWRETYDVKDLRKVKRRGYDLARTLIVDDTPKKCERNYGNAIYVPEFRGDPADDALPRLSAYLETLADVSDVRRLEKRRWRAHY
ncbi:HAD family hydrolase [Blastopirellula retiformator]|uniref:HAD family hydrolase n=1 Tax=Blastopirellula retiformator TaxID=2527970 RepID=UPI001C9511F2|nr:HAD family hydrolase [Blastopirellula retiformator]